MQPSLLGGNGVRCENLAPKARLSPRPGTPVRRCSNYAVAY